MQLPFDDAVVGAGILGLAHAYHLAKKGRRVIVFERHPQARGASVRNFGMLWPIGQPAGELREMAVRSLAIWREVLKASELWHDCCGSLHLAYHEDEWQVLNEFHANSPVGRDSRLLTPQQTCDQSPLVQRHGLRGSLWSPTETCVDPRQVVSLLPGWLERSLGVAFQFGTLVTSFASGQLMAGGRTWRADRLWVCSGADLQTLFPVHLAGLGLIRCKLQMLRTVPRLDCRLGPMLAAGLTLRHYASFQCCPSLALLRARVARDTPKMDQFGIHVLVSQHGTGEFTIGDSHQYGDHVSPFDGAEIEELILSYLHSFLNIPDLRIGSRWQGVYLKHPSNGYSISTPADNVVAVNGVGGNGMTLSFGLAEMAVDRYSHSLS